MEGRKEVREARDGWVSWDLEIMMADLHEQALGDDNGAPG